jgi:DNA-binding MarR family transcriptional regulator
MPQLPDFVKIFSSFVTYASESQQLMRIEILHDYKVTPREYSILRILNPTSPLVFRELVNRLEFGINPENFPLATDERRKKSTISQAVAKLETDGLIEKIENVEDKRQPLVARTMKGNQVINEVSEAEQIALEIVLANGMGLHATAQRDLVSLLLNPMQHLSEFRHSGKANRARVYDYLLGGNYYLPVDLLAAERFLVEWPDYGLACRANRAFQERGCRFLLKHERITQFIDIGAGYPPDKNTHEAVPDCAVVYVDNDEDVVAVGKVVLAKLAIARVAYLHGDVCDPDEILWNKDFRRLIDVAKPVGIILGGVLHYVLDDRRAKEGIHKLASRLAPGTCFVVSHPTEVATTSNIMKEYRRRVSGSKIRDAGQLQALFSGMEIIGNPKPVFAPEWQASTDNPSEVKKGPLADRPADSHLLAAIFRSRKPIN